MGYPDDLLSPQEKVIIHKHSHWKMLLVPYFVLIVTLGVGAWLAYLARDLSWNMVAWIGLGVIGLGLIVWAFLIPFIRWRTTHFIVTTDRVMAREGVLKRTGIDMPHTKISNVRFEHGLIDRIFGAGTLIIESSAQEPLEFDDVPKVEKIHTLIYRQLNDNPHDDWGVDEQQAAFGQQPTQQYTQQPGYPQQGGYPPPAGYPQQGPPPGR